MAVLENRGVASRHDLLRTEPGHGLADVVQVLARVGDDEVARIDLRKASGGLGGYMRDGLRRPGPVVRVDLTVVNGADAGRGEVCFRHAVAPDQIRPIADRPAFHPFRAKAVE